MLGLVVVGLVASLGVWLVLPPRFYAQATIVVTRQQVSEAVVEPTLREDALSKLDALAAEVLSSRDLVKLVEEFDLYPELRDEETMAEIIDRVRKDVSVVPIQSVNRVARDASALVYSIGVEAGEPEAAAGIANRLASFFVDLSLAERQRAPSCPRSPGGRR